MPQQLALAIQLKPQQNFASYIAGPQQELVELLRSWLKQPKQQPNLPMIYLWGEAATGKTHLLSACCQQHANQKRVAYLSFAQLEQLATVVLEGLEQMDLLCLDDLHWIAGLTEWENALLTLFNHLDLTKCQLLVAAQLPISALGLHSPALQSRLQSAPSYQLHPLNDPDLFQVIQQFAQRRGLEIGTGVVRYLLRHYPRDLHSLDHLFDQLDQASLSAQRRLTVPFVRQLLQQNQSDDSD